MVPGFELTTFGTLVSSHDQDQGSFILFSSFQYSSQ